MVWNRMRQIANEFEAQFIDVVQGVASRHYRKRCSVDKILHLTHQVVCGTHLVLSAAYIVVFLRRHQQHT